MKSIRLILSLLQEKACKAMNFCKSSWLTAKNILAEFGLCRDIEFAANEAAYMSLYKGSLRLILISVALLVISAIVYTPVLFVAGAIMWGAGMATWLFTEVTMSISAVAMMCRRFYDRNVGEIKEFISQSKDLMKSLRSFMSPIPVA